MIFWGGPVCWILLLLFVGALMTYLRRLIDLRHAQIDTDDFLKGIFNILDADNAEEALSICEDTDVPVSAVTATAIRQREASARVLREAVDAQGRAEIGRLDRRLAVLAILAQVAPLLGLLGTVLGFIRTVLAANAEEVVSRAELLNGTMSALLPAALGLFVTLTTLIFYGSLRVRLDRIVVEMEAAASQIVGYISTRKEEGLRK